MNATTFFFVLGGLASVLGGTIHYISTIPRGKVPENPAGLVLVLCIGIILSLTAFIMSLPGSVLSIVGVFISSSLTLYIAFGILWLLTQRKTPIGDIKIKVGDKLLPFSAATSEGTPFNSDELSDKRVLFKFFRGGWCPYCSAELASFEKILPDLEKRNINVVALSKDSIDEAGTHKIRDNIPFTLLSDKNLNVIRQYGVEHHRALGGVTDSRKLFGIPLGKPKGFSTMAIPTSLLIDENGIIKWIDQSEDYRIRSNKARVLKAVANAFN